MKPLIRIQTRFALALPAVCAALAARVSTAWEYNVVHTFGSYLGDARYPNSRLAISGSTVYGSGLSGGVNNAGAVFRGNLDGSGFSTVATFPPDGSMWFHLYSGVLLSGSTLYGTATEGGSNPANGVIYRVNTDGSNFSVMHNFTGGADGANPSGPLIQAGSKLYGTAPTGGINMGIIYQIDPSGAGYSVLRAFNGSEGAPGALMASGSTLYGLTGTNGGGSIFKMNTNGSGFTTLYTFGATPGDGRHPAGPLLQDGATLYGMTYDGGSGSEGTIYKINTDGSGYSKIHDFAYGNPDNGARPIGSLVRSGTTLYGTTSLGGSMGEGTLFQVQTDGSGFQVLHSFPPVPVGEGTSGSVPNGELILVNSTLYGTTYTGGSTQLGVLYSYSLPVPEPSTLLLGTIGTLALAGIAWRRRK